ncbi:molybdopterin dinucleotide binding domain-containing protein [Methanofollis aquaemaris]|uniref:molybdopterin dinucleotide binding domain-containing protein n=1 Tax=Methanofollis aquaemaris TaxID=126734 RepID=UPI00223F8777|nr:molybdopterin dinucleotide binding domain-containing protein [Methanofollis aquaemaris]
MKALFNTGRTSAQGQGLEAKAQPEYMEATSICMMNPVDLMDLELEEGERVLVRGPAGEVILTAVQNEGVPRGTVYVPMGPYANAVIDAGTHATGMPDYKSCIVDLEPTDDEVKRPAELMEAIGGLAYEGDTE